MRLNDQFNLAAQGGNIVEVQRLLADARVNPAADFDYAIRLAASNGHLEVVRLLLADARVNPAAANDDAIVLASENGHVAVVRLLLADARVNPAAADDDAIVLASENGHHEVVRLLLVDARVNPAAADDDAIHLAARKGHVEVVRLLLADARVNPAGADNYAIRFAAHNGHVEVVRLLLADARVNPAAYNNQAIRMAAKNGHLGAVDLLLDCEPVRTALLQRLDLTAAEIAQRGLIEKSRELVRTKVRMQKELCIRIMKRLYPGLVTDEMRERMRHDARLMLALETYARLHPLRHTDEDGNVRLSLYPARLLVRMARSAHSGVMHDVAPRMLEVADRVLGPFVPGPGADVIPAAPMEVDGDGAGSADAAPYLGGAASLPAFGGSRKRGREDDGDGSQADEGPERKRPKRDNDDTSEGSRCAIM